MEVESLSTGLEAVSLEEIFPLLDVPDLVFEEIARHLNPMTLLTLQQTCKIMHVKCYRAQRLIKYPVHCLHIKAPNKIMLYHEARAKGRRHVSLKVSLFKFLTTRFKLSCDHITLNMKNVTDIELKYFMKLFLNREVRALFLMMGGSCTASASTLNDFLKKTGITGINIPDGSVFVRNFRNIPALDQVVTYEFWEKRIHCDEDFLLANNFRQLEIYTYGVNLGILRKLIRDLINGKKRLVYLLLGNALSIYDDDLSKLFCDYRIVNGDDDAARTERPIIIDKKGVGKGMERNSELYRYKVICNDGTAYEMDRFNFDVIPDLVIRKCM